MAVRIAVQKLMVRARFNSSPIQSSSIFSETSSTSSPISRPSFDRFLGTLSQINCISSSKVNVLPPLSLELVRKGFPRESILGHRPPWNVKNEGFHSLVDERFPKWRPSMKNRRKRAALRPKGPYYWVQYTPGEPIPHSRPNEGRVRGRNHRKRMEQRADFRSGLTTLTLVSVLNISTVINYEGLYVMALGSGSLMPRILAFGADQYDHNNSKERRMKSSFFNWFFFVSNFGTLLSA